MWPNNGFKKRHNLDLLVRKSIVHVCLYMIVNICLANLAVNLLLTQREFQFPFL